VKSILLFVLMLVVFAGGAYVVGWSEGTTTWVEVAVLTAGFGIWQIWERTQQRKRRNGRGKPGAA
jgi:hypothetical protein